MSDDKEQKELERQSWLNDLIVEIKDSFSEYKQTLKGYEDIHFFFATERDFWVSVESTVQSKGNSPDQRINVIANYFRESVDALDLFRNEVKRIEEKSECDQRWMNIIGMFSNPKSYRGNLDNVYSKSSVGTFLVTVYRVDPIAGDGAYRYFKKEGINAANGTMIVGFIRAYEFDRHKEENIIERHDIEKRSIDAVRNEAEQKTHDFIQAYEKYKTEFLEWKHGLLEHVEYWRVNTEAHLAEVVEAKKTEFKNLSESYKELLKLQAPVRYWTARAKNYRKRGWFWVAGLTAVVMLMIVLLTFLLYFMPDAFHHKLLNGEPEAIRGIILFALIISFSFYLARVFSRMAFSSFHIERDAEEREQLTYVYLALIKDGAIPEKEREIILQALFSRVETGLLGDDSSPTMPIVGNILEEVSRRK